MWLIAALIFIGLLAIYDFVIFPRWERKQRAKWNKEFGGVTVDKHNKVWINMEQEPAKYRITYTANPAVPFWACAVKGCQIPFPHEVGITEELKWKHVWADLQVLVANAVVVMDNVQAAE